MPEKLRQILEPNTSTIYERLLAVTEFNIAGYDVHLNFSPVIIYDGWLEDYKRLFKLIDQFAHCNDKHYFNLAYSDVKAEVIFLTHNEKKHEYNLANNLPGEDLLWKPEWQEEKVSQYGGNNLRYNAYVKGGGVHHFTELHQEILPWMTIRYIF